MTVKTIYVKINMTAAAAALEMRKSDACDVRAREKERERDETRQIWPNYMKNMCLLAGGGGGVREL